MSATREPIILTEDVVSIDGTVLIKAGQAVTRKTLEGMPKKADKTSVGFSESPFAGNFAGLLETTDYGRLATDAKSKDKILERAAGIQLPNEIVAELKSLRSKSAVLYHHILATTLLTIRCMMDVNPNGGEVSRVAQANMVKDLGMARTPPDLLKNRDHLSRAEFAQIKKHPVTGMVLNYYYFGEGLESLIALRHHERSGKGYPRVASDKPNQVVELITAIDVFNALMSPRSFRRERFPIEGAVDELIVMTKSGELAGWAPGIVGRACQIEVKDPETFSLGRKKSFIPKENHYGLGS